MAAEGAPFAATVTPPTGSDRIRLVLILGALIALGPLTIDMYLPALPAITTDLLTTEAAVQLTLTGTLVGLAVGQLVLGPLTDAFGRKRPLLVGAGVHVGASVLCAVAPNIAMLVACGCCRGRALRAGMVVALAIVRDLDTGRAAAKLLSQLILVMSAAPIVAPTLGGALLGFTSGRIVGHQHPDGHVRIIPGSALVLAGHPIRFPASSAARCGSKPAVCSRQ